jgi:hypothetical protein
MLVAMPASRSRVMTSRMLSCCAAHVEPALGGDFVPPLGHQHGHGRLHVARKLHHLRHGGHLEVELHRALGAQAKHVGILDVATVLAQVHGDAVGAAKHGLGGRGHGVGFVGSARLPNGCDMVNVHA